MAHAWIFQDAKQLAKRREEIASWYVGWFDPESKKCCKSCGPGAAGQKAAFQLCEKRKAELITGTYQSNSRKTWKGFRAEYEQEALGGLDPSTRDVIRNALNQFERVIKPVKMAAIKTQTIDRYRTQRRAEPGRRKGGNPFRGHNKQRTPTPTRGPEEGCEIGLPAENVGLRIRAGVE